MKIVLTQTQSKKIQEKKDPGKHNQLEGKEQTQRQRTKMKPNLTKNRFEELKTMDISNTETTHKQTNQKPRQNQN